ncbi:DUF6879 family protein [Streptomyces pseudovenezuelae]|uniref:DUF6879 domain-containing protein n=1 Tax=Streptomyces pseudovenezuelae TaxID=67350 RepID=A0ABT6LDH0_9ACTN|nr:DUF6879 family protein [Streptomyces pseudovenezuelae]MDH6214352.1 hypothetical protein [Streptomyces pseudovenezuelae]
MPEFIDDSTFGTYFETFERTAWRLETRRGYASDRQSVHWARWKAGEDVSRDPTSAWRENIQRQTAAGKKIERIRLVDDPPTEGQLFLLARAPSNEAVGEDMRNMWRADAEHLGLPALDFWLFDDHRALVLHFDEADEYLGAELVEEPTRIAELGQLRDAAWPHAIRRRDFAAQVASSV